jgi:hypothetical protein
VLALASRLLAAQGGVVDEYGPSGAIGGTIVVLAGLLRWVYVGARHNTEDAWKTAGEWKADVDERVSAAEQACDKRIADLRGYYDARLADKDRRIEDLIAQRDQALRRGQP